MDKKKKKGKVDGTGPKGFRPSKVKPGRKKKEKKEEKKGEREKEREKKRGFLFIVSFYFSGILCISFIIVKR